MNLNFSKSKIFLYCCLSFVFGIAIASFLPLQYLQFDLWFFSISLGFLIISILFWQNKKIRLIFLLGLFLVFGLWRYSINIPKNTSDKIWFYNGQTVTLEGVVVDEPDIRQRNVKLEVKSKKVEGKDVNGKLLITTNLYPEYNYGDKLEINCNLQTPKQFQGFAYDRYLARFDIYSVCYYPQIKLIESGQGNKIYHKIFSFKDRVRNIIIKGINEPEAGLARAIIIGDKKAINDDLRSLFSKAGISHIVAISGMHIGIISVLIMSFLLGIGLNRKKAFYVSIIFLIFYIILIGAPASAMRAGLMGFLVLWALNLGRLNKLTNSIVLAGAILLVINPKLLRDDIGFQLSFLAVLGIAYFYPLLDVFSQKIKKSKLKGIRDILFITISAQIFTLPIIIYNFSVFSIIAPISNLFVLWCLPFLIFLLLSGIGLSLIMPSLSVIIFLPAWILLKYIIFISKLLTSIPYSYIEIDYIWFGWFVIYYFIILSYIRKKVKNNYTKKV